VAGILKVNEEVVQKRLTSGRPCDFSGIDDFETLETAGGSQWPVPTGDDYHQRQTPRLFTDGVFFHPGGRARLIAGVHNELPEEPSGRYPLRLLTGRGSSSQWHTGTRSGTSLVLSKLSPREHVVEMHAADMDRLGVAAPCMVVLSSRRGSIVLRAAETGRVQPGQVFVSMHCPAINTLTFPAFDPISRQPAYKHCSISVRPAERWETAKP